MTPRLQAAVGARCGKAVTVGGGGGGGNPRSPGLLVGDRDPARRVVEPAARRRLAESCVCESLYHPPAHRLAGSVGPQARGP